jgi:hypothetical protein
MRRCVKNLPNGCKCLLAANAVCHPTLMNLVEIQKPYYEGALSGDHDGRTYTFHRSVGRCHVVTSSASGGKYAFL